MKVSADNIRVMTVSLGCPKNRVDTERLLGALGPGVEPVDEVAAARLVLINTCGFIEPAIEESVSTILDAVADMEELDGQRPVLAVAGCLVSRFGRDLVAEMPEVDLWLSTDELDQWPAMVREALGREADPDLPRSLSTGPGYAYLKISEGCSHDCRFCTIPSIRGPLKSWPVDYLAAEAKALVGQGVPELIVVGQDSTHYGADLGPENDLQQLLARILPVPGLEWLRLMYLYPAGLTRTLLSFLRDAGKPFLPYFDIPLQHAHPEVLSSMGRPFARNPEKVVERVREFFPEAALRTTFIVGYPGETDEHFQCLMDFVRATRFHHLGVFPYWPEDGTPAAAMDNQVPDAVKLERRDALMELQAEISGEIMAGYVGETLPVLVEEPSPEWPGLFVGRTWFQAPEVDGVTYVSAQPGTELAPGMIVEAEVEDAKTYDLVALA
ncbi:30S ribosomal protein S12 methylthiotransferase RimO [Pseudodesulfovibrio senegalensis]|uniref:Ribosomal protein uS12 methylthiotransferase RimO n=1 Tax=Pseudodesulfovibrio senegalensis TaxID=1721087 RepID=A0A6N6N398_9BACT|nr:30S ribosomal protein S12 methylthiotransferase RimO [Pseudodesulfovibrio senegalensis]KAB1442710.1 30S ribosomal protein S12 methylthiotransferase RimO [Pseudodesulfovibrio senegalensis]